MDRVLYCIEHEETFPVVSTEECPAAHDLGTVTFISDGAVIIEGNHCCFDSGYAFCPPPQEFFIVSHNVVPCPEEIAQLDASAVELFTHW